MLRLGREVRLGGALLCLGGPKSSANLGLGSSKRRDLRVGEAPCLGVGTNNISNRIFLSLLRQSGISILIIHTNLYKSIQIHTIVSIPGFLNFSSSFLPPSSSLSLLFSSLLSFYPNALTSYTKNEIFSKAIYVWLYPKFDIKFHFSIGSFLFILIAIQFLNISILAYNLLII